MNTRRQRMYRYGLLFARLLLLGLVPLTTLAQTSSPDGSLSVQTDRDSASVVAGDWIEFSTVITNEGTTATPPLVAHLNVAAVVRSRHVDPEDWSPVRTQYQAPIPPGGSARLSWQVHTLFEGDFATFVTILSPDETFVPLASTPLYIHAAPDSILPLAEVAPLAMVVPILPLALLILSIALAWKRRNDSALAGSCE